VNLPAYKAGLQKGILLSIIFPPLAKGGGFVNVIIKNPPFPKGET
jgi:hypothetical protein